MPRSLQRLLQALDKLPQGLRDHIDRVRHQAHTLASRHGLDPDLVDYAAAAHDLFRDLSPSDLLDKARSERIPILPAEQQAVILLHGPLAANLLEQWGEDHPDVLQAVRWHTTACPGMSDIAKAVFLADKLDPTKAPRYPFIDTVRSLANDSLNAAMLEFLTGHLDLLRRDRLPIHPASLAARNELLGR